MSDSPEPEAPAPQEPKPKWRRRKDARPEELVKAALVLFVEQGFATTNLKDVARAAGVSKGTVYLYFKSKEDLLLEVVRSAVVPIMDFADDEELSSDEPASVLLARLIRRWMQEFEDRGLSGVPKLVMAESGNFPELAQQYVDLVVQRARRLFARVLKRGMATGEFRPLDVRQTVQLLLAPLAYAHVHKHSLGPYDPGMLPLDTYVDLHLDLFLRGIRADPGAPDDR